MPPTQHETGEPWSSILAPRTTSRQVLSWQPCGNLPPSTGSVNSVACVCADLFYWVCVWRPQRHRVQHHGESRALCTPVTAFRGSGDTDKPSFVGSEGVVSGLPRLQQDWRHVGFPEENRMLQNQLPASGPRSARQVLIWVMWQLPGKRYGDAHPSVLSIQGIVLH